LSTSPLLASALQIWILASSTRSRSGGYFLPDEIPAEYFDQLFDIEEYFDEHLAKTYDGLKRQRCVVNRKRTSPKSRRKNGRGLSTSSRLGYEGLAPSK